MAAKFKLEGKTKAFEDLFRSSEGEITSVSNNIQELPIESLRPYPGHPFKMYEGERLDRMVESIRQFGVFTPIAVKAEHPGYIIISGHNRTNAAKLAGLKTIKAVVLDVDEDEAAQLVVESNFRQRDSLLPSEKALGYKMKYEAMKNQGRRTDLEGGGIQRQHSHLILGRESGENGKQIQRYLRIAILNQGLLDLLDNGRLGFTQALEISYINEAEQKLLLKLLLAENSMKISLQQAKSIRCLSEDGDFNMETLSETILKSSQSVKALKLNFNEISGHLPPGISSTKDIMKYIQEALEYYSRKE